MLPLNRLDDQSFAEIVERSRKMIQKYYPAWTDENYHDPGITIIELFAWLKEMQQFYLDQIGEKNYIKFLKLMGNSIKHTSPAFVDVEVESARSDAEPETEPHVMLPRGVRTFADKVAFETVETAAVHGAKAVMLKTKDVSLQLTPSKKVKCYIFGADATEGSTFSILFDKALPTGKPVKLFFEIFNDYEIKRNPVEAYFKKNICWEVLTSSGYREIEVADKTHDFLESNYAAFSLSEEMTANSDGMYELRLTLLTAAYDIAPMVTRLQSETLPFIQKYTYSEVHKFTSSAPLIETDSALALLNESLLFTEKNGLLTLLDEDEFVKETDFENGKTTFRILNDAHNGEDAVTYYAVSYEHEFILDRAIVADGGVSDQRYTIDLKGKDLIYDDFELMVSNDFSLKNAEIWYKVSDFDTSMPTDRHYTINEQTGELCFGNGEKGRCPAGIIVITGYALTDGAAGNIKQGELNGLDYRGIHINISNSDHAVGGSMRETVAEAFTRTQLESHMLTRAVTKEDYEAIVKATPALLIEKVSAYTASEEYVRKHECSPNNVVIAVKPYTGNGFGRLSGAYHEAILRHLEPYRMAGTEIILQSPEYIKFDINAEVYAKPYFPNAKQDIENAVRALLAKEYSDFGTEIMYDEIYGIIDTLDCVDRISTLVINAEGNAVTRSENGNIQLPPYGLMVMNNFEFYIYQ